MKLKFATWDTVSREYAEHENPDVCGMAMLTYRHRLMLLNEMYAQEIASPPLNWTMPEEHDPDDVGITRFSPPIEAGKQDTWVLKGEFGERGQIAYLAIGPEMSRAYDEWLKEETEG